MGQRLVRPPQSAAADAGVRRRLPLGPPHCNGTAPLDATARFRCQRFFFSEPLYEVLTSLFVRTGSQIASLRNDRLNSSTLCVPAGQTVYDLDRGGRNSGEGRQGHAVNACFRMLDSGAVEGVATTELAGRASINALGMPPGPACSTNPSH